MMKKSHKRSKGINLGNQMWVTFLFSGNGKISVSCQYPVHFQHTFRHCLHDNSGKFTLLPHWQFLLCPCVSMLQCCEKVITMQLAHWRGYMRVHMQVSVNSYCWSMILVFFLFECCFPENALYDYGSKARLLHRSERTWEKRTFGQLSIGSSPIPRALNWKTSTGQDGLWW